MFWLNSLLYTDGFMYGVFCESIPSCSTYCTRYGVSYKVCCVIVLPVCICMLYHVMSISYKSLQCFLKSLLYLNLKKFVFFFEVFRRSIDYSIVLGFCSNMSLTVTVSFSDSLHLFAETFDVY
jgi:hypothetical protein